ncbi:MAG: SPOR domain-containing protein [Bacteroidetes bacterium]|nr:SPOR domain-containing protein [Bacteroidota bacterium]
MGNLNFQDDPNENPEQNQPDPSEHREPGNEEAFIEDPTVGSSKFLWIAIIVVLIAGGGGAVYMLNRAGYLKFPGKKSQPVTTMTTPTPASSETAAPTASNAGVSPARSGIAGQGAYSLQISAFRTRQQANRYVASLQKKGIDARVMVSEGPKGGSWYRVCTGSFDTKLKAIAAIQNMKKRVGTDVWVVPAE